MSGRSSEEADESYSDPRDAGESHHTLSKILKGESLRRSTFAKIVKQLPLHREPDNTDLGQ